MTSLADYLLQQPLYAQGLRTGQQGTQTTPVQSWQEGLARTLQGGVGGLATAFGMQRATDERADDSKALGTALEHFGKGDLASATKVLASRPNLSDTAAALGMQAGMLGYKQQLEEKQQNNDRAMYGIGGQPQAAPAAGGQGGGNYASAIAGIESAGQPNGGYGALGPETGQGRAHGKYQVMPSNIGPWTKEVLGQEMTPQQFLASPQAQDAVFNGKFGQYVQKYGSPQAAARAWFAGEGGMSNPNARDVNGTTVAGYEQKFSAGLGQPQQGGPPQSDTINYQGLQLPRAAMIAATNIRDHAERQKAIQAVVMDAVKFQREGAPMEQVQGADGRPVYMPRNQAAGMPVGQQPPGQGSKEADIVTLQKGDPNSAEYAQAHARVGKPEMSQGGQLLFPNMDVYRRPAGGQPQGAPTFQDTPSANFDMGQKLNKEFTEDPAVKNYMAVKPVYEAMQTARSHPSAAADLNLIAGLVNLYSPGAGALPRGEILRRFEGIESIPGSIRTAINRATRGGGMDDETRGKLMLEAEARLNPMLNEFNSRLQQAQAKATKFGLSPDIFTLPAQSQQPQQSGEGKVRHFNPATGRLE